MDKMKFHGIVRSEFVCMVIVLIAQFNGIQTASTSSVRTITPASSTTTPNVTSKHTSTIAVTTTTAPTASPGSSNSSNPTTTVKAPTTSSSANSQINSTSSSQNTSTVAPSNNDTSESNTTTMSISTSTPKAEKLGKAYEGVEAVAGVSIVLISVLLIALAACTSRFERTTPKLQTAYPAHSNSIELMNK